MPPTDTDALAHVILQFRQLAIQQLPVLEKEIRELISRKETDTRSIELLLGILLSMLQYGVGKELFRLLHQYYKNIDRWGFITYQALSAGLLE